MCTLISTFMLYYIYLIRRRQWCGFFILVFYFSSLFSTSNRFFLVLMVFLIQFLAFFTCYSYEFVHKLSEHDTQEPTKTENWLNLFFPFYFIWALPSHSLFIQSFPYTQPFILAEIPCQGFMHDFVDFRQSYSTLSLFFSVSFFFLPMDALGVCVCDFQNCIF